MNMHKFTPILYVGILIVALAFATGPNLTVHAQCGVPGQPPCPPPSGGGGNKPTPVHVFPPLSLIPTSTPGPQVISPNTGGGQNGALPAVQNPNPGSSSGKSGNGLPGPLGMIIAILIIVVCFGGGLLLFRSRRGGGSPVADDLNPQPFPPKAIGDGSNQFAKMEDSSNQFAKMEDGSNQFMKFFKQINKSRGSGGKQP